MSDEKQTTALITELETADESTVSPQAAASTVLAVDELIADIHKAYASDQELVRRLRPFVKGSFKIVLELTAAAAPLIGESPILAAIFNGIREYLAIKLHIAGRNYTIRAGDIVEVEGGERITVSPSAAILFDPKSTGAIAAEEAFERLQRDPMIQEVRFRREGEPEAFSRVPRSDFAYMRVPETIQETEERAIRDVVAIRSAAFDVELSWRVVWQDHKLSVDMEDEDFLKLAISGEESFSHKDKLDVTMGIMHEFNPRLETWIPMSKGHTIKKVWAHIKPDEQLALGDTDNEDVSA